MEESHELRTLMEQWSTTAARMAAEVEEWQAREFTGAADGGSVVATVDAVGTLLRLEISVVGRRRLDGVTLADAVVSAVHAAEAESAEARGELMGAPR